MFKKLEEIPENLKKNGLFCVWRGETRNGKQAKAPYNPMTGAKAQCNNPETFSTYEVATMAAEDYDGIGVGIFGDLVAIDLDHCLNDNGMESWAADIVRKMHTYTEISPSGKGLRLYCRVTLPFVYDRQRYYINRRLDSQTGAGIEVYVAGVTNKYATITGDVLPVPYDTSNLEPRNRELCEVLEKYMVRSSAVSHASDGGWQGKAAVSINDETLLEKACRAKNGDAFERLWRGDWERDYPSHSHADLALCGRLAYWTGCNATQMDRLFRQSGLYRSDKWDRRSGGSTYGADTIQQAIAGCQRVYEGPKEGGYPMEGLEPPPFNGRQEPISPQEEVTPPSVEDKIIRAGKLTMIRASDVAYEEPHWIIKPYLQAGKGTLIQGNNGAGKTSFLCGLVAHISTGEPFLGISVDAPGNAVICTVEDDQPVLRGRIEESGGNLDRCLFINETSGLTITSPDLEKAIQVVSAKLLVFDPLQAFLGPIDMNRANETRPVLAALFEMCKRNDCACAIIAHTGKSSDEKSVVNRSLGSVDIPASMRSIIHVIENPEDEEEHIAFHVKSSNAPCGKTIHYRIVDRGGVQWTELTKLKVDEFARRCKEHGQMGITYDHEPLVQVFNALITARPGGGFWSYADLTEEGCKILGFPPYQDLRDLRSKIDALAKDLLQKDGLIVTHGQKGRANKSGIRIQRYRQPEGYQTRLEDVG